MAIHFSDTQLSELAEKVCESLILNGFKHIRSPSYFHAAQQRFHDASGFHCFVKKVSDGYIHVGVAKSRVKDSNNIPRVRIGVTLSESELIYSVRGFYTIMFPWGMVHEAFQWIDESTEQLSRLRANPNFIPGVYGNPAKAKARAFVKMFISKMRRLIPF